MNFQTESEIINHIQHSDIRAGGSRRTFMHRHPVLISFFINIDDDDDDDEQRAGQENPALISLLPHGVIIGY